MIRSGGVIRWGRVFWRVRFGREFLRINRIFILGRKVRRNVENIEEKKMSE